MFQTVRRFQIFFRADSIPSINNATSTPKYFGENAEKFYQCFFKIVFHSVKTFLKRYDDARRLNYSLKE